MLDLDLDLDLDSADGAGANAAPTDIAWTGRTVAEDAALGVQIGSALSAVDPDMDAVTFTIVSGGDKLHVVGDTIVVGGALDFDTEPSISVTVRATDEDGAFYDEVFVVTVTDVDEEEPENPPPPDPPPVVDDPDRYDVLPYSVEVSGSVKFAGKKKSDGQSAKMLMDFNGADPALALEAGKTYTIHITLDASLMSAQGALATVGIAFKAANDFWLAGAKGPATANAVQVYGDNLWNQQAGFTEVDGGDILHGSQLDLWLQIQTSADGTTATIRTSSDGNDFDDEFTDADLVVFDDVGDVTQWGPAAIFHSADGGPFSFSVEYWAAEDSFTQRQFVTTGVLGAAAFSSTGARQVVVGDGVLVSA